MGRRLVLLAALYGLLSGCVFERSDRRVTAEPGTIRALEARVADEEGRLVGACGASEAATWVGRRVSDLYRPLRIALNEYEYATAKRLRALRDPVCTVERLALEEELFRVRARVADTVAAAERARLGASSRPAHPSPQSWFDVRPPPRPHQGD